MSAVPVTSTACASVPGDYSVRQDSTNPKDFRNDKRSVGARSVRCYIACHAAANIAAFETRKKCGAGDRSRTDDFDLGKVALYQLSYTRPAVDF